MELGLALHVIIVGFSFDDQVVDVTKVNLGRSFRLLILEQGLGRDSSLNHSIWGHLHKDEIIIVASILPPEWIGPSMELSLANHVIIVRLSEQGGMIIELSKIWGLGPLNILMVVWMLIVIRVGVRFGFLLIIFDLNGSWLFTPVFDHPIIDGWHWLSGSMVKLAMEMRVNILNFGVSVPSFLLEILGLGGRQIWLSSHGVWHRMRILIEMELMHVNWITIWSLYCYRGRNQGSNSQ